MKYSQFPNGFLCKTYKTSNGKIPDASYEVPYDGAKEMILIDEIDNRVFLRELVLAMYEELPEQKRKKILTLTFNIDIALKYRLD